MRMLLVALVMSASSCCLSACGAATLPSIQPQDAQRAVAAAEKGLVRAQGAVDAFCAVKPGAECDVLRRDMSDASACVQDLRDTLNAVGTNGSDLAAKAEKLGGALKSLLLDLSAASRE